MFAMCHVFRVFNGRGADRNIVPREDLSWRMVNTIRFALGVAVECVHKRIVRQCCEIVEVRENGGCLAGRSLRHRSSSCVDWDWATTLTEGAFRGNSSYPPAGSTPCHTGKAKSSGSSLGPPVRLLNEPSSIGIRYSAVALRSFRLGART